MNKNRLINALLMGVSGFMLMTPVHAGTPVWAFAPVAGYPPSVTVGPTGTASIQYKVTNQSQKSHTLQMKPIQGITSSGCAIPLGYQQSCTLNLSVSGSALTGDVIGGPVLCEQGNPNLCYQPSQANSLAIRFTQQPPIPQYTVTPSAGANGSISPSADQVVNSGATLAFTATADAGYGVNQWLVDGNLVQTGGNTYQLTNITTHHTVNVTFGTAMLTPSPSTLALSVQDRGANAALTGNPRQITIQNNGSGSATNVSVNATGLPSGTSVSSTTCSDTLNAGDSCTITLTPGTVASSDSSSTACTSGTQPVAGTITITADGGLSSQVNAYVLGYGCQYQGGFIYSVDDSYTDYPESGSIGGKVTALTDQSSPTVGIVWDADPACLATGCIFQTNAWDLYYGQNQLSVRGSTNPEGSGVNGPGNTYQISYVLTTNVSEDTNVPPTYAAGVCISYNDGGYTDWYLPAICEMGPASNGSGCVAGTQNIVDSLPVLISTITPCTLGSNCLAGFYWSSTEVSSIPRDDAWSEHFASSGASFQFDGGKTNQFGIRCSRDLTL